MLGLDWDEIAGLARIHDAMVARVGRLRAANAALLAACEVERDHLRRDIQALESGWPTIERDRRIIRLGERAALLADAIARARGGDVMSEPTTTPEIDPTPWTLERRYSNGREIGPVIRSADGKVVAEVWGAPHPGFDRPPPTARLLAAAPDLFAAAAALLAWAEGAAAQIEGEWGDSRSLEAMEAAGDLAREIVAMRAAIGRATHGGTSS